MSSRAMFVFSAISGFLLVAFGAFGAHVLSQSLGAAEMAWIHTGLEYQAYHTLAVMGLGAAMLRRANIWFYWSSALMALGMAMLSPTIISLPFKLLLFVLVDGWALTMGSLANSFVS